jgi:hypothetical protein
MGVDNVSNLDDWQYKSLSQLAQLFGVSRDTVKRRIEDERIKPGGERRNHNVYHIGDVAKAVFQFSRKYDGTISPEDMEPKDRKDWYQGESERIKIQCQIGELVKVSDVRETMAKIITPGIQLLESLPDILERDFSLAPDAVIAVEKRIDILREEWATMMEAL